MSYRQNPHKDVSPHNHFIKAFCGLFLIYTVLPSWTMADETVSENSDTQTANAVGSPQEVRDSTTIKETINSVSIDGGPPVKLGGALRFTYFVSDFNENLEKNRGRAGLDIFRLNAKGQLGRFQVDAEYRFYPYMNTLHHGWVGYRTDSDHQIQGGITKVPFGLLPYASHNFWFGMPYYVGLADDYDLGIKHISNHGSWNRQFAFFKNEEFGDAGNLDRYSFDPVTTDDDHDSQSNTFHVRQAYTFGEDTLCSHETGLSGQYGNLFNDQTGKNGDQWAVAAHMDTRCWRWNLQLQYTRFEHHPHRTGGDSQDTVTYGAFGSHYEVASKANMAVANVAYNLPVQLPRIELLTCYNDFSMLIKDETAFDHSYLNTTGCLLSTAHTFTYIDVIRGKNMAFMDDGSLAGGGSNTWKTRLNINFGIYW